MKNIKNLKKEKSLLVVLLFIALAAIFFAVLKIFNTNKIYTNPNNVASSTTEIKIEEKIISDKNDFYEITAKYPVDSRDLSKEIELFITSKINKKQTEWKIGGEIYNSEKQLNKDFPDRSKMIYTYDISYEKYESKIHNTVSYVFTTYEFTGGAHGNSIINTFTFNNVGKVNIDNILNIANDNNDIKLSRVLASNLLANGGDMMNEDMVMSGLGLSYLKSDGQTIDLKKCGCDGFFFGSNFQNFYITDDGVNFLFDQYAVAPGAAGIVKSALSWETLKPFLINPKF